MTFKVTSIIARYNSKSGGPPRTVNEIAAAGSGHWHSDLLTTDYQESDNDLLLVDQFPGEVRVLPRRLDTIIGGLSLIAGPDRHYRARVFARKRPDVVHIHGVWSTYLAAFALAAMRQKIPFIVTPHGMLEPWSLGVNAAQKSVAMTIYQRRILLGAAALHATSTMEADNIRRLGVADVPVFVVPNSVAEPVSLDRSASQIRSPDGKRTLLFLSRVHKKKGLELLLEAWNEVRPTAWQLLIVGSGEPNYIAKLKDFCALHRMPDVEFRSHVEGDEREALFRQSSVFILPTFSENFGNVVAEALIRGVPVITTTGTPWSGLVDNQCGWYVPPTVAHLKQVLAEATATDQPTLSRMGDCGRRYAVTHFTLPVVRAGLLGLYRSAIQKHR